MKHPGGEPKDDEYETEKKNKRHSKKTVIGKRSNNCRFTRIGETMPEKKTLSSSSCSLSFFLHWFFHSGDGFWDGELSLDQLSSSHSLRRVTARISLETLQRLQATGAVEFSDSITAQHARSRLPICCIRAVSMRCNNCMRHSPNGIC